VFAKSVRGQPVLPFYLAGNVRFETVSDLA
jgi:hypothetical protein